MRNILKKIFEIKIDWYVWGCTVVLLRVPLKVSVEIGKNWGELK